MNDGANRIRIHAETEARLNFASHQSSFALIRDLRVENPHGQNPEENLVLRLEADVPFLKNKSWPIDRIQPQGMVSIADRDVQVDGEFLRNLNEAISGALSFRVEQAGAVLGELSKPVELLAYNEWGGADYMPELLAAFCMPNNPAVDRILHGASVILRQAGKADQIDGYKSRSRERVWEIASAIYAAIANLGLSYAVPPQSFEKNGQKIRLPDQVVENKVATCLDTVMLFASVFEQARLNPVIALPEGHAMVGVWLQPEKFSDIVMEEAEDLRKRIALDELLLIETTLVTTAPAPAFSKALAAAQKAIAPEHDASFGETVDIAQARAHRIKPLPGKTDRLEPEPESAPPPVELRLEPAPTLPDFDDTAPEEEQPTTPTGRLERWQRKLLDLTLNNRLLNYRPTKNGLQIICPNPGLLEDKLAAGSKIQIHAAAGPAVQDQDEDIHLQRTGEEISEEYALEQLEQNRVLVALSPDELATRAVAIYRKTQTALQEGGANTLYLALGFLLWKRNEKDQKRCRAPLILLPVTLVRKSVRSGVRLCAHDDEPRFNTTLLEMLGKDFSLEIIGLDADLPTDDSGIDVAGIWNRIRRKVKDVPGFEVVEDVVLGHFSFAKYLMWKDLADRTDELRKNAVVRHLLDTPRESYDGGSGFVQPQEVDREYKPSDLLMPLSADSSQAAAIATADRGEDFIIIGPPGTGKSQTISNLIAHMLGQGKRVLFVSEKTAALEVVHRRLKQIGLGNFCLEIHSNKARKADVINQLRATWEMADLKPIDDWNEEAENLLILRDRLNLIVNHLHLRHRNGLTPYHAIGVKIRDEALARRLRLSWPSAQHHDKATLNRMRDVVEALSIQAQEIGEGFSGPFHLIEKDHWSSQWEEEVVALAGQLAETVAEIKKSRDDFCQTIGITPPDPSLARLDALAELGALLVDSHQKQTAYALGPEGPDQINALKEAVECLKAYAEAQASISCAYEAFAWRALDGTDIARRWADSTAMWWLKRLFAQRGIVKEMRAGGAQGKPEPGHDAEILARLRENGEAIDRLERQLSDFRDWAGHATDPSAVESLRQLGERARDAVAGLADTPETLIETRKKLRELLHEGNDLLAPDGSVGRSARAFSESLETLRQASDEFKEVAGGSVRDALAAAGDALAALRETANTIIARRHELRAWCAWQKRKNEAIDLDLLPLVEAIEAGRIEPKDLKRIFEAAYCAWWSRAIIDEDEVLRSFSSPEHEHRIDKFRQADDRFQKLTAQHIAARLAGKLPEQGGVGKKTDWGVIRHELRKKMRHKPVRRLLSEAPGAMTTLAPCFMMSPLSIAQYLPPEQELFDVVIFDEASQITVWDAIGALARGKQVIVAGDPKQMPPTNFFGRADDDPDGLIDTEGDLESILDEMLGSGIPQCTLNLHYRSRRESLILFSNDRYYGNSLVTFPSPSVKDDAVRLIRPAGFYARGGARHNEGEAKAIVAEIVSRLTHDDPVIRERSIGVVTFNSEQQTLIEDLLDKARMEQPEIEYAFSPEHVKEPVFVKNLETVQGDERDVILFSVTYGPDRTGRMYMNFGPLNRQGGERRLNVAVSRSRYEMLVFSTLRPDQMDLSRSKARAVRDLKHFLEYAERGVSALTAAVYGSVGDFDSPFEVAVSRELKRKGWEVYPQIGVSGYRIDMGVVHPDQPGEYLAGIECDGAMYHSSAIARERDKIRQSVLESLGWTLFRIWSTDWWINKNKELAKVDEALRKHLEADRRQRADDRDSLDDQGSSSETGSREPSPLQDQPPPVQAGREAHPRPGSLSQETPAHDATPPERREPEFATRFVEDNKHAPSGRHDYREADLAQQGLGLEPDATAFYQEAYESRLNKMLDYVIDTEGPIHEDVLVRRIALHHGFKRSGDRIRTLVLGLAKRRRGSTREADVGAFFWAKGTVEDRLAPSRCRNRDQDLRKVQYICSEELRAINEALSLGGDAVRIARALGIARLSKDARGRIERAVSTASRAGAPASQSPDSREGSVE